MGQTNTIIDEYEHLKKIPDSLVDIEKQLQEGRGTDNNRRTTSLTFAQISRLSKRYTNRAMILLVGETGGGKSSTIYHLFAKTCAKTLTSESFTRETTEWFIESNVYQFLIQDLKFSIIDTPGCTDTNGIVQDSANMACIKKFFETYPSSQDHGLFPNFILLVVNACSNRYKSENSNFTKSLKALSKVGVVDKENPNVLIVITHAMNAGQNEKTFHETNQMMGDHIADMCSIYLGVKPSYVFLENDHPSHGLPKVEGKDWLTVLPNKTEQPANLFKALKELAGDYDPIGKLAISHFLGFIQQTNLTKGHCVKAELVSSNTEFRQIFGENCETSELKRFATMFARLRPPIERDIMKLVDALENKGIVNIEKVQQMNIRDISSTVDTMLLNSNQMNFLTETLGIERGDYKKLNISIGQSYDIFSDSKVSKSVYQLTEDESCFSHNFEIPSNIDLYQENKTYTNAEIIESKEHYVCQRLRQLNVRLDNYKSSQFTFAERPKVGFNYKNKSNFTFSVQSSLFSLKLRENKRVVSEDFKMDVGHLPDVFNKDDQENAEMFLSFFKSWGYHVIVEQKIGGSVEGNIQNESKLAAEDIRIAICAKLSSVLQGEVRMDLKQWTSVAAMCSALEWNEGNFLEHVTVFERMDSEQWIELRKLLSDNAVALDSYRVEPIHEAVKKIDRQKCRAVEEAFKDLMKVNLLDDIGSTRVGTNHRSVNDMWRYVKWEGVGLGVGLGVGAAVYATVMTAPYMGAIATAVSPVAGELAHAAAALESSKVKQLPG